MNRTIFTVAGVLSASRLLLVDSAVKGTVLLALAAVVALILRRDSAATRHLPEIPVTPYPLAQRWKVQFVDGATGQPVSRVRMTLTRNKPDGLQKSFVIVWDKRTLDPELVADESQRLFIAFMRDWGHGSFGKFRRRSLRNFVQFDGKVRIMSRFMISPSFPQCLGGPELSTRQIRCPVVSGCPIQGILSVLSKVVFDAALYLTRNPLFSRSVKSRQTSRSVIPFPKRSRYPTNEWTRRAFGRRPVAFAVRLPDRALFTIRQYVAA